MKISLIAAMSKNRVIGKNNQLPWHIKEDFRFFKDMTLNKVIIMGRKTFDSMGKALPKRINLVLTRSTNFKAESVQSFQSLDSALDWCRQNKPQSEIMIIGGSEIYKMALPIADRIYLTVIDKEFEGDAFFPPFEESKFDVQILKESKDGDLEFKFLQFDRRT